MQPRHLKARNEKMHQKKDFQKSSICPEKSGNFSTNTRPTIWVADKPLLMGGEPKEMFIDEFVKQYNRETGQSFEWFHNFGGIDDRYANVLGLVLCKINDKINYGVFTKKFIPKGTELPYYAGELTTFTNKSRNRPDLNGYCLTYAESEHARDTMLKTGKITAMDSFYKGNHSRFLNQLQTLEFRRFLESASASKAIESEILNYLESESAKINVEFSMEKNKRGEYHLVGRALKNIQAGEQLGYEYSLFYEKSMLIHKNLMLLHFDRKGKPLLPKTKKSSICFILFPDRDRNDMNMLVGDADMVLNRLLFDPTSKDIWNVLKTSFTDEQFQELIEWDRFKNDLAWDDFKNKMGQDKLFNNKLAVIHAQRRTMAKIAEENNKINQSIKALTCCGMFALSVGAAAWFSYSLMNDPLQNKM